MTTMPEAQVWQPLHDEPLFTGALLRGIDAISDTDRARILTYLDQVARVRRIPLHTTTAFNALHFGFDLENGGYRAAFVDPELFVPLTTTAKPLTVLPVGTFVRIERGEHLLWAEVIARFGADEADTDGWIPPRLSGARDSFDEHGCRPERMIIDPHAFGGFLNRRDRNELQRLRRRGVLDDHGHLTGRVYYPKPRRGRLDDIALYTEYMLTTARSLVVCGPLGSLLTEPDDDTLAAALRAALDTIDALLGQAPHLRRWAGYATPTSRYQEQCRDNRLLGKADLDELIHTIARPTPSPRYTGVWPLLASTVDAAKRAGSDDEFVPDPLEFTGAAEALVHANLAVADLVTSAVDGLLPNGVHVRVDDVWQSGGVWRTQAAPVSVDLRAVDPLQPLGLGRHGTLPEPTPGAGKPDSEDQHDDSSMVVVDYFSDNLIAYTVALRPIHLNNDTLPLPERFKAMVADGDLIVELHHDGDDLAEDERVHRAGRSQDMLTGIAWPLSFYPGIKVMVALAHGARRLSVTTNLLDEPLTYGADYRWAADLRILATFLGDDPGTMTDIGAAGTDVPAPRQAIDPLRALIITVLRRHGATGPFGARRLTGPQLLAALFGDDLVHPLLLWQVIHTCERLVDAGKLICEPGGDEPDTFAWCPNQSALRQAQQHAERQRQDALRARIKQHWVPPRLRALPDGWCASDEAREAYACYIQKLRGRKANPELPDGYTFVKGHTRGSELGPYWVQLT
ncbi:hypothetical protein [Kutzneria buriramensis]|uniref:Uncharacterized protein n=1 Tax=Kutzneria buriramensis TaxID=1045776 RepID=A0A3E0GX63_9PSEU|nr:hypothetical protein [Kutzneria buriramensis]REH30665.1 hypothetical protein BCF44_12323 [Kutzneria buriramensis]